MATPSSPRIIPDEIPPDDSLKGRMLSMITEMTELRDQYVNNEKLIELEKLKNSHLSGEVQSLMKKIELLQIQYDSDSAHLGQLIEEYENAVRAGDECEKQRRTLELRINIDDDRLATLEQFVRETSEAAIDSEKKYDETFEKLQATESEIEKAEARTKQINQVTSKLQNEMKVITAKLKTFQLDLDKIEELEDKYEKAIGDLKARLSSTNKRTRDSNDVVNKLQLDLNRVKSELSQYQGHSNSSGKVEIRAN